ncbi:hypothetical protein KCU81_g3879, partial [Aureobasidium melanogenum]|uniref:Uncharacterized protein n=1 Tax=Aureobasidium melanogenum (strain CBS 110374) TaxID=1043003 RepID=A0A074VQ16_AURM1
MTGFLDLPYEVREIVYNKVLGIIIARRERILWVPDVLEQDINHQTLAITYRRARDFDSQEHGILLWIGDRWPAVRHRDIASFVSLARTCQALHTEVSRFAWKASDFKVEGSLDMIRELLRHRLALHMSVVTKSFITSLELIISEPWEMESLEAMKDIVQMINAHLPALAILTLRVPNVTLRVPASNLTMRSLCQPAKAMLAQLLPLRSELLIDFKGGCDLWSASCSHYHSGLNAHMPKISTLVELLTTNYAIIRAKAINRQRKKIENDCLDSDYYIHMTLGLRSSTHYETIRCCLDHKIQNHLRKIYLPSLKMTTRCASPDSDDRALLLKSRGENGLFRIKNEQD